MEEIKEQRNATKQKAAASGDFALAMSQKPTLSTYDKWC